MIEQMKIPIVQIGSSRGIRIPKKILTRLGMHNTAIAIVTDDSLTLKAGIEPREGWEADYKRCSELNEDGLHIPDDLDTEEWEQL